MLTSCCVVLSARLGSSSHTAQARVGTDLPVFEGRYGHSLAEHERFGRELGAAFRAPALARLASARVAGLVDYFTTTYGGLRILRTFETAHARVHAGSMAEIRGLARGIGVSAHAVLVLNLVVELAHFAPPNATGTMQSQAPDERCSDYALWPYCAHNEDSHISGAPLIFLARISIDGDRFVAVGYAGELLSGALGFNSHGVGFTVNYVGPHDAVLGGIGRAFISRELLRQQSLEAAIEVATADGQCVGHNYQLLSTRACAMTLDGSGTQGGGGQRAQCTPGLCGAIVNVESISHGRSHVEPVAPGGRPLFHANHLLFLDVPQSVSTSSRHRTERVAALPLPSTRGDLLAVLSDQADAAYPIYHDGAARARGDVSGETTLLSALFDVRNRSLVLLRGAPAMGRVIARFDNIGGAEGEAAMSTDYGHGSDHGLL